MRTPPADTTITIDDAFINGSLLTLNNLHGEHDRVSIRLDAISHWHEHPNGTLTIVTLAGDRLTVINHPDTGDDTDPVAHLAETLWSTLAEAPTGSDDGPPPAT